MGAFNLGTFEDFQGLVLIILEKDGAPLPDSVGCKRVITWYRSIVGQCSDQFALDPFGVLDLKPVDIAFSLAQGPA